MAELPQERTDFPRRWRRELKYGLDINIGKSQPREARAECFPDKLGAGARYFRERSKGNFVIGIGKGMRGEALDDFGAVLRVERRGAERREEPSLDFRGR